MNDFILILGTDIYINKSNIVSIRFKGHSDIYGRYWRLTMSNGDFFDISLDELNTIIGTGE